MAARVNKIRHDEETRKKIQTSQIINRLQSGFNGDIELTSNQVSIAKMLLAKVLPDLTSVDMSASVEHEVGSELKELLQAVNGRTRGIPNGG
jgi:hypothetical protein